MQQFVLVLVFLQPLLFLMNVFLEPIAFLLQASVFLFAALDFF